MWSSWREWAPTALGSASPPGRAGTALHGRRVGQDPLSSSPQGAEECRVCVTWRTGLAAGRWKAREPNGLSNLSRNYPGLRVSVGCLCSTSPRDETGWVGHQQTPELPAQGSEWKPWINIWCGRKNSMFISGLSKQIHFSQGYKPFRVFCSSPVGAETLMFEIRTASEVADSRAFVMLALSQLL